MLFHVLSVESLEAALRARVVMRYQPFVTEGSEYVQPVLEAIVACEDAFAPVRDVCSGALWIVNTTKVCSSFIVSELLGVIHLSIERAAGPGY